jgi:hypothetical protein
MTRRSRGRTRPDADRRAEPEETVEEIAALYRGEIERARAIVTASSLDDTCIDDRGRTNDLGGMPFVQALPQALVLEVVTQVLTDRSVRLALQRSSALTG